MAQKLEAAIIGEIKKTHEVIANQRRVIKRCKHNGTVISAALALIREKETRVKVLESNLAKTRCETVLAGAVAPVVAA
jgi:uncharacterized Zn finger protein